jgi:hypothetical protein
MASVGPLYNGLDDAAAHSEIVEGITPVAKAENLNMADVAHEYGIGYLGLGDFELVVRKPPHKRLNTTCLKVARSIGRLLGMILLFFTHLEACGVEIFFLKKTAGRSLMNA